MQSVMTSKTTAFALGLLLLLFVGGKVPDLATFTNQASSTTSSSPRVESVESPVMFERADARGRSADFRARASGYSALIRPTETLFIPALPEIGRSNTDSTIAMRLMGGNSHAVAPDSSPAAAKTNYFIGNDTKQWRSGVETVERIRYQDVYTGIDIEYYGTQERLEYDFIVKPGGDPDRIRFRLDGAENVRIDEEGKLLAGTGESLNGRLLLLDALNMDVRTVKLQRDPGCAVCSGG